MNRICSTCNLETDESNYSKDRTVTEDRKAVIIKIEEITTIVP